MRYLWIVVVALIAALGAGCSTVSTSPTTTVKHHSTTSTTLSTAAITPGATDKTACASYLALKAQSKPTGADIRSTIKALHKAEYKKLRTQGAKLGAALLANDKAKATAAGAKISNFCSRMGLG
jgi:hypothetical protein